jgi:hypothetical protein
MATHTKNLHLTGDSPRERVERHRARSISKERWLYEVNSQMGVTFRDLTVAERRQVAAELGVAGSEFQQLLARAYAERWTPFHITGHLYFLMLARRRAPAPTAITVPVIDDVDCFCAPI